MDLSSIQKILSETRRAVDDYAMISPGETIAVGVSGGKDSLTLLCALRELSRFHPAKFKVKAITLDTGLPGADLTPIQRLCDALDVELILHSVEIYKIVFEIRKEKNPCSLCANLRRGALYDTAKKFGMNKVALGHHFDDAVETFFLNLFREGRIGCFSPVTYLDRTGITLIRPLLYVEESEISRFARRAGLEVLPKYCPADGKTERETVKQMLRQYEHDDHGFKKRIFGAMERAELDGFTVHPRIRRQKTEE